MCGLFRVGVIHTNICCAYFEITEHRVNKPEAYKEAVEKIKEGFQREHIAFIADLPLNNGKFFTCIRDYIVKEVSSSFWCFLKSENPSVKTIDLLHNLEKCTSLEVRITLTLHL